MATKWVSSCGPGEEGSIDDGERNSPRIYAKAHAGEHVRHVEVSACGALLGKREPVADRGQVVLPLETTAFGVAMIIGLHTDVTASAQKITGAELRE